MRRAQYSLEFMIFMAMLSVLFLAFLVNYTDSLQQLFVDREKAAFDDLGQSIRTTLIATSKVIDGFKITLPEIPETIAGIEFEINNTPYYFYLSNSKTDYVYSMPYTIGKFRKGSNVLWNVEGVLALSDYPPIVRADGVVNFTQCNDLVDNDEDSFVDLGDVNCTVWSQDNETG
ncbi:MAG: hypothetical protein Q7S65_05700 [Nanoarchaeota archaeon]|nr:hypothetical protein [Nanoarchaeota archaeon]